MSSQATCAIWSVGATLTFLSAATTEAEGGCHVWCRSGCCIVRVGESAVAASHTPPTSPSFVKRARSLTGGPP
jgi:hypothetical protein